MLVQSIFDIAVGCFMETLLSDGIFSDGIGGTFDVQRSCLGILHPIVSSYNRSSTLSVLCTRLLVWYESHALASLNPMLVFKHAGYKISISYFAV